MFKKTSDKIKSPIVHERFLVTLIPVILNTENSFLLTKTAEFIENLNMNIYKNDITVYSLLIALRIITNMRLSGTDNTDLMYTSIKANLPDDYSHVLNDMVYPLLISGGEDEDDEEVLHIQSLLLTAIKYQKILNSSSDVIDKLSKIEAGHNLNLQDTVSEYKDIIYSLHNDFEQLRSETGYDIIHTDSPKFKQSLREAYDESQSPSVNLETGIKMLNRMLSKEGGFLPKLYVFIARVNSFKTALLMYISMWIKKYNGHKFAKIIEEGKKPTVIFFSLENYLSENIIRYFSMFTKGKRLNDVKTFKTAEKIWEGIMNDNSEITMTLIHMDKDRLKPSDIERVCAELQSNNYVPIAIAIDYLRLMADDDGEPDLRVRLGDITQALHRLTQKLHLPIITAHHTNRDADLRIEQEQEKGRMNLVKKLGPGYISESKLIDNYADFTAYIGIERSPYTQKKYLTIKRDKCRYEKSDDVFEYFAHELIGGFILTDDYNLPQTLSTTGLTRDGAPSSNDNLKQFSSRGYVNLKNKEVSITENTPDGEESEHKYKVKDILVDELSDEVTSFVRENEPFINPDYYDENYEFGTLMVAENVDKDPTFFVDEEISDLYCNIVEYDPTKPGLLLIDDE